MTKRRSVQETLWQSRSGSRHSKDEAGQSWEWSTVNDDLTRTPTPPPRMLLRATCSKRQPQAVTAETAIVFSLDSHVSVMHTMSRSRSAALLTTKSALLETDFAFSRYNLAGRTLVFSCMFNRLADRFLDRCASQLVDTPTTAAVGGPMECHPYICTCQIADDAGTCIRRHA